MTINSSNTSSLLAHQKLMNISAKNVANVNNSNFDAKDGKISNDFFVDITNTNQPTSLTKELPKQISMQEGFDAQIPVINTQNEMIGTLLNLKG